VADAMSATFTDNAGVFHNFGAGAIAGNLGFAGVISGNAGSSTIFIILAKSLIPLRPGAQNVVAARAGLC